MSKRKRTLIWFTLLLKSLLKKLSYLVILLIVPVLVLAMHMISKQDSGVLNIVLYQENPEDRVSSEIVDCLMNGGSVIQFEEVTNEKAAIDAVVSGKANAAWIFDKKMSEKVDKFAAGESVKRGLVRVIELEDNPLLQLSREKLFGTLYPFLSYSVYEQYVMRELVETDLIVNDPEAFQTAYDQSNYEDDIFEFSFPGNEEDSIDFEKVNYLITPLRGMLIMVLVLSNFAAQMYYLKDKEKGVFVWMPQSAKYIITYGYQYAAMLPICVVVYIALVFSGLFTKIGVEILAMLLFTIMLAVFSNILRRICGNVKTVGAVIPIVIIVMVSLSQIFLKVNRFKGIQMMLPTYYYINVVHNGAFFTKMLIYVCVAIIIDILSYHLLERKKDGTN